MKKIYVLILTITTAFNCSVHAQKISTFAGSGITGYTDSGGVPALAEFNHPWGLAMDKAGNIFVADHVNSAIRKISASGVISTYAGTTTFGHSGDNGPASAAMLERPAGIALDNAGNLYIADKADNRIRKIDTSGIITTIAGTGTMGYTGDGGIDTAATFNTPTGIAIDAFGNIYIADSGNNVIRKINTSGIVATFAGTGTGAYTGDRGPATAATLSGPVGIAIDASGNIYIADNLNNVVRKINASMEITTFAGNDSVGYSGDGGPATAAKLYTPNSIAFDHAGNVYFSDQENAVIRVVNSAGTIYTIAGNGTSGYSGDGGEAIFAQMYKPMGIVVDSIGDIYIGDFINSVVRFVNVQRAYVTPISGVENQSIAITPNPTSGSISVTLNTKASGNYQLMIKDMLGQNVFQTSVNTTNTQLDVSFLPAGCYIVVGFCNGVQASVTRLIKT